MTPAMLYKLNIGKILSAFYLGTMGFDVGKLASFFGGYFTATFHKYVQ